MKQSWVGTTVQIAAIFAFRMLGLFMLIPVFTLYAKQLQGATPILIGVALGAYGLTQGILQLPFGILSDRYGRKPLISIGLVLFALGSIVGACTHTMSGMILARILQGAGAIGSVLIALLADLTTEQHRTRSMALIGATIGVSFSIAFIVSPSLATHLGLAGIFYLTTGLALLGLMIVYTLPNPGQSHQDTIRTEHLKQAFLNPDLLRLDAGIFFQHFILVASFYALPILLQTQLQTGQLAQSWHFYLPVIACAFLVMVPIMMIVEKRQHVKAAFIGAITIIIMTQCAVLMVFNSLFGLGCILFIYFVAFNFLEANLPSLISKQANPKTKGCALGIYSSSQFLGIFVGGTLAGFVYQHAGAPGVFIMNTAVALLWLSLSHRIRIPVR